MAKLTIPEQEAFVIRSRKPGRSAVYFQAHNIWGHVAVATIFRTYEAGLNIRSDHVKIMGGLHKDERIDVVPLYREFVRGWLWCE